MTTVTFLFTRDECVVLIDALDGYLAKIDHNTEPGVTAVNVADYLATMRRDAFTS